MAIDKNSFTKDIAGSMHEVALGGFIPTGMWAHTPGISPPFDPSLAKSLLKDADFSAVKDISRIVAYYFPGTKSEVLNLIEQWRKHLGVNISAEGVSWDDSGSFAWSDLPHIYVLGWTADYRDPNNFMYDALQGLRRMWDRSELWELIDGARHELNQSARQEMYKKAERILVNEAVLIPIMYPHLSQLVKPWIHNWSLTFEGVTRLENVIIEQH